MFAMKHSAVDLGFVCSNFDESLHFYRDLLGMEVVLDIQIPEDTATGARPEAIDRATPLPGDGDGRARVLQHGHSQPHTRLPR